MQLMIQNDTISCTSVHKDDNVIIPSNHSHANTKDDVQLHHNSAQVNIQDVTILNMSIDTENHAITLFK